MPEHWEFFLLTHSLLRCFAFIPGLTDFVSCVIIQIRQFQNKKKGNTFQLLPYTLAWCWSEHTSVCSTEVNYGTHIIIYANGKQYVVYTFVLFVSVLWIVVKKEKGISELRNIFIHTRASPYSEYVLISFEFRQLCSTGSLNETWRIFTKNKTSQ